jgi:uracil-DNA glycosylase family 4
MKKENNKKSKLDKLKSKMLKDDTLPLQEGSTNLVFGDGDPNADMFFIGEGPGYWEDQKGIPFVGNAGKFLDQLLQSIEVPREDVFITNVICYRPPQNRDPLPEEIAAFQPYVDNMIKIIEPKIIVTLGRFSMAKFIPGVTITTIHGKEHEVNWNGNKIIVVPMYHPAAGLRNGEIRRRTVEDFKILPDIMKNLENDRENKEEKEIEQLELV